MTIRIVDVTDTATFDLIPPCADPAFDHRTCDYWEDASRGSKAHRPGWPGTTGGASTATRPALAANPFAPPPDRTSNPFLANDGDATVNPFAPAASGAPNPFLVQDDDQVDNPFAPRRPPPPALGAEAPRKLQLLARGLQVFGSYAKVLLADDAPAAFCQFGPLSAYPRALQLRELYPQLPDAPLPAVISCIATTHAGRDRGLAARLVGAVCDDLAGRGFAAVEAYPEARARPDATSAADPAFWVAAGFRVAVDDERFPVLRRELA